MEIAWVLTSILLGEQNIANKLIGLDATQSLVRITSFQNAGGRVLIRAKVRFVNRGTWE
jgi:hypothetical protein